MQLYFIRHGQSVNNALWSTTGSSLNRVEDPELTPIGARQAELVAEHLAGPSVEPAQTDPSKSGAEEEPFGAEHEPYGTNVGGFSLTHLYTSLMVRAVQTGTIISKRVGMNLAAWPDIHECGGIYLDGSEEPRPGKSREFFETNFPDLTLPESLNHQGWWNRPFEEAEDRERRAKGVIAQLKQRHGATDHRVGLITHGEFYSRLLCRLLAIPEGSKIWFTLNNTGITRVDMDESYVNIVYLNRIEFLPEDLIT
jgi:2,3-bisphosphoglycerate-dependent phosphoglycerate mutase